MGFWSFFIILSFCAIFLHWYATNRALRFNARIDEGPKLPSLPQYYGRFTFLWFVIPTLAIFLIWIITKPFLIDHLVQQQIPESLSGVFGGNPSLILSTIKAINLQNIFPGTKQELVDLATYMEGLRHTTDSIIYLTILFLGLSVSIFTLRKISFKFRARQSVERTNIKLLIFCSVIAILTTIGIVFSLIFEAMRFFDQVPLFDFLFGLSWSPQTAIREDQVASSGSFGAIPIFTGTLLITIIAMSVSIPIGLLSAIYLSEYANKRARSVIKPLLEILAGIPTVVYGFFAAITVGPFLKNMADSLGFSIASESAIAAGGVMGIMIIPFISSLSDDVISSVPNSLRDGSLAMGATRSETIKKVVFPAALPGIVGAVLLAVSRAIGETMIVVMAAGIAAKLTANPFDSVTTVTVQIVTLLVGDQEFDSAKTLAAFALGITLFFVTLMLNLYALKIVKKYREKYD